MEMTNRYRRVPLDQIIVKRSERQRREIETGDLEHSIKLYGVLQPIILTEDFTLVAGERRFTASQRLALPDIPCRFIAGGYSEIDLQIVELEENVKRQDLPWRDSVAATARLHTLYQSSIAEWTQEDSAHALGVTKAHLSNVLRVARDLNSPKIADATGFRQAYNVLARADERASATAISDIMEAGTILFNRQEPEVPRELAAQVALGISSPVQVISEVKGGTGGEMVIAPGSKPVEQVKRPDSILVEDFNQWIKSYSGKPFNFIHCDFPYGVGVFEGKQSGRTHHDTYSDTEDDYWTLLKSLCDNLDRLMAHSGHLMFWFSMEHYSATIDFFTTYAPSLAVQKFPLIWTKSDNVGILPDPKRGPRRIYETALIASREDRQIVRAVSNAYHAPTDKLYHHSTKPEPVLKHFFQMFVDEHTTLFDPTCGSGSALRAAEALGATAVLGLERDPELADRAKVALRQSRALRRASKTVETVS